MTLIPKFFGCGHALLRGAAIAWILAMPLAGAVRAQNEEAVAVVDPSVALPPSAVNLAGVVGWRNSPRLAQMMDGLGAEAGVYRRTLFVHVASEMTWLGQDLAQAKAIGMKTWLTCVGTPQSLSPNPDATGDEFNTGVPQFARYPPTDAVAWADEILAVIAQMEADFGLTPDYLELWNEPERVEWFKGSSDDYLEMYAIAALHLRAQRPGMRIGGPGLAGWRSSMDGEGSFLLTLVEHCALLSAPLDFVSWHNYAPAGEILSSGIGQQVKALAAQRGLPPLETAISEWNIYPAAEAAHAVEFDGPHAAANLAGLLACAEQTSLDKNMFFLDYDEDNDGSVTDLQGKSLGMITQHGVEKPVARLLRFVAEGAAAPRVSIEQSDQEWNVRVQGHFLGTCLRLIVSNDVVDGGWVFAKRSRENGMDPGWLYPIWLAAGGPNATEAKLMAEGLTQAQAQAVLAFIPEVFFFDRYASIPRPIILRFDGGFTFQPTRIWRFTPTVNAPAQHEAALRPWFDAAEQSAQLASATAGADYLTQRGYPYTPLEVLAHLTDFLAWAAAEGIPFGVAVVCNGLLEETHRDARLASADFLNGLPETLLVDEDPAAAGLVMVGRELHGTIDPDTVFVLDIEFAPIER